MIMITVGGAHRLLARGLPGLTLILVACVPLWEVQGRDHHPTLARRPRYHYRLDCRPDTALEALSLVMQDLDFTLLDVPAENVRSYARRRFETFHVSHGIVRGSEGVEESHRELGSHVDCFVSVVVRPSATGTIMTFSVLYFPDFEGGDPFAVISSGDLERRIIELCALPEVDGGA